MSISISLFIKENRKATLLELQQLCRNYIQDKTTLEVLDALPYINLRTIIAHLIYKELSKSKNRSRRDIFTRIHIVTDLSVSSLYRIFPANKTKPQLILFVI